MFLVVNKLAGCTAVQWLQYFFAPVPLSQELLITVECSHPSFGKRNIKKTKSVQSVPLLLVTVGNMSRIKVFHH